MVGIFVKELAKGALTAVLGPYVGDARDAVMNTVRDTVESAITGRRTIDEWANITIKGVDKVKNQIKEETEWQYVGGKLNFSMSKQVQDKAVISFELYYQDENKKWQKVGAESDMYASNFTLEALEDIKTKGIVSFEVE